MTSVAPSLLNLYPKSHLSFAGSAPSLKPQAEIAQLQTPISKQAKWHSAEPCLPTPCSTSSTHTPGCHNDFSTPLVHPCSYDPLLCSSQSLKMVSRCQLVLAVWMNIKFYFFVARQPQAFINPVEMPAWFQSLLNELKSLVLE